MTEILGLDKLLQIEDFKNYGLKVEGLVRLRKFLSKFNPRDVDIRYPLVVPDFFAVPVQSELDNPQLRERYLALMQGVQNPRIVLARSSDLKEMPGRFETHPSFFDPANPEQSFQNWLEAAKKVRASGSGALIGQSMIGELEDFEYDVDYNEKNDYRKIYVTSKSFGGSNSSFVGRSSSVIRGPVSSFVACGGIGTKIARGDKDVSMIQQGKYRMDVVNLAHDYSRDSFSAFKQNTIDLVTLAEPNKVTTLQYDDDVQFYTLLNRSGIPFHDYLFQDRENGYWGFHPRDILDLLGVLQEEMKTPVELEGCVNDKGLYLFQLRGYEIPRRNFEGLTKVPEVRRILETERESIGFDQFRGDLVVSHDFVDCKDEEIFAYTGNVDEDSLPALGKYKQVVFPMILTGGLYEAAHSFGYTSQILVELEKKGVRAVAIAGGLGNLAWKLKDSDRFQRVSDNTFRVRNVTVECDGNDAQIYYNE